MSQTEQNLQTKVQTNVTLNPETLNILTEKFNEIIQSFQELITKETENSNLQETRSYQIPINTIKTEQKVFEKHEVKNITELLGKAIDKFLFAILLIDCFSNFNRAFDLVVYQVKKDFDIALEILKSIKSFFENYNLIENN